MSSSACRSMSRLSEDTGNVWGTLEVWLIDLELDVLALRRFDRTSHVQHIILQRLCHRLNNAAQTARRLTEGTTTTELVLKTSAAVCGHQVFTVVEHTRVSSWSLLSTWIMKTLIGYHCQDSAPTFPPSNMFGMKSSGGLVSAKTSGRISVTWHKHNLMNGGRTPSTIQAAYRVHWQPHQMLYCCKWWPYPLLK